MTYSDKMLDKHRYINVEHDDWCECTVGWWTELLEKFGFADVEIRFSGFGSQGDGASFTGYVHKPLRVITFMMSDTKSFPIWRKLAEQGMLNMRIDRANGFYYVHENSTTPVVDAESFRDTFAPNDEMIEVLHELWDVTIDREYRDFEQAFKEFARTLSRRIYDALEEEYDHLTSDEAVSETLEANDIRDDYAEAA